MCFAMCRGLMGHSKPWRLAVGLVSSATTAREHDLLSGDSALLPADDCTELTRLTGGSRSTEDAELLSCTRRAREPLDWSRLALLDGRWRGGVAAALGVVVGRASAGVEYVVAMHDHMAARARLWGR